MKEISFFATEVEYTEAIGGEIVQVYFDEDPDQDPFDRTKCYVMISQNYEFPVSPSLEWHDGIDDSGGEKVLNNKFTNDFFELIITGAITFKVKHYCEEKTFTKIQKFLQREFGDSK